MLNKCRDGPQTRFWRPLGVVSKHVVILELVQTSPPPGDQGMDESGGAGREWKSGNKLCFNNDFHLVISHETSLYDEIILYGFFFISL